MLSACVHGENIIKSDVNAKSSTVIHISPTGTEQGQGTPAQPLDSLTSARNKIRTLKSSGVNGPFEVRIGEGDYQHLNGLVLSSEDSGSVNSPVVYRALPGVKARFFGGTLLDAKGFEPLTPESEFYRRLVDQNSAQHIQVINLKEQGVDDLGTITSHGWSVELESRVPPAMLTIGGKRMPLSRWPNHDEPNTQMKVTDTMLRLGLDRSDFVGYANLSRVVDKGIGRKKLPQKYRKSGWSKLPKFMNGGGTIEVEFDRMRHWHNTGNIFMDGIVSSSWEWTYNRLRNIDVEKKQFTLAMGAALTGVGDKLKSSHFFFENIFE
jgi:hypothetical protein